MLELSEPDASPATRALSTRTKCAVVQRRGRRPLTGDGSHQGSIWEPGLEFEPGSDPGRVEIERRPGGGLMSTTARQ